MQLPVLAGREDAAQKLFAYNDLVMEMSGKINLTGIKDPEESLIKNVYDSLTVYDEKYFPENAKLLDLGTGAGFPGVPLAILRPDIQAVLADSIQKKLTFVENACQKLGIKNVKCLHIRAEEGGRRRKTRESFDIVTARAMKGPGALDELKESGKILRELNAEVEEVKNLELPTGEKRCILYIRKTAPCPKTYPRKIGIAEKKPILGK